MAEANGTQHDSLRLLRRSIAAGIPPIPTSSPDPTEQSDAVSLAEASFLTFNLNSHEGSQHVALPLTQETRFVSANSGKALDLRTIYFCWLNKDTAVSEYINAAQALTNDLSKLGKTETVPNLVFVEKLDLTTWLAGDVGDNESDFIKPLEDDGRNKAETDAAVRLAQGGRDVEMRDADLPENDARRRERERLKEIYAAERKMGDRNTVLRGAKIQDFSGIRKYSALFLGKSRPQQQQQQHQMPTLTNNPALRPSVKAAAPGRRPEPIILLSPSASSLLRLPNIKSFLVEGTYVPLDSSNPNNSTGANILHLTRKLDSISSQPQRFILVDSPDNFRPDYWSRVVAVFTTGQTWQFKNYKWQNPAELFANALGVYVGWKGEVVPDTVKGWGRGVVTVQIDKGKERWRDREVVEDVWSAIEGRMKAMGWGKSMP